jgi:flagellar biosynthesis protein FlhA
VLSTHLTETIKRYAHELLTRDEVNHLIKTLKEESPAVVEEVVPAVLKPGEIQKVLQNLLREGVSIRDLGTILETLGDYAPRIKDPEVLTEYVRNSLARSICRSHSSPDGRIRVVTLDPKLEDMIKAATERSERGSFLALSPALIARIGDRLKQELAKLAAAGHEPVILCSPQVRAQVRKIAEAVQPGVTVLSYNEIVQDARVESLGMVAAE